MNPFLRTVGLLCLLAMSGCRDPMLQATESELRVVPETLDFGALYTDDSRELQLSVLNDGRTPLTLEWSVREPFSVVDAPVEVPSGETLVTLRFSPRVAGRYSSLLEVKAVNVRTVGVALRGVARSEPGCEPVPCSEVAFSRESGACVATPAPDGTACDPGSRCLVGASCQAGRCVGEPISCDDSNACTVDVCNALTGCEHLPAPPCPGDGVCNVGVCDPVSGCGLAPAPDGTTCGSLQTCAAAEICISGQCLVRDPPDGYVCAEASPCQGEGRCVADTCVRVDAARTLSPTWRFDSALTGDADAGVTPTYYHDFVLEPSGELTLGNFFQSPALLRANAGALRAPLGTSRRCVLWNARLVCADYPSSPNGKVSQLDQATGALLWSYDVRASHPEWVALTTQIFMARLVVQGTDRLAALYEAYPLASAQTPNTQCRNYFLVVLDASGHEVMGQRVQDPLLEVCNHPHPYGVVADQVGNLFIAFSPTSSPQAPLVPDRPMLLMSFTHDGIFRWKLTDFTIRGGELAVARGLLYPENSSVVLTAATGQPAFALPQDLGRVVVADARLLPAPVAGSSMLNGYEAGVPTQRWTHTLPAWRAFWSDQIRLATWRTSRGDRTVALTFTQDSTGTFPVEFLHAIDVRDGREAFSCPLDIATVRTPPQLFEVANGSLGLMAGALDPATGGPACGKCDPPFAGSAAEFFSFSVGGLSVPNEPWVGTFGGAGHDHQENVPLPSTGN